MSNKTIIAYHANCSDGKTAAFVAWKALGRTSPTVPVNYDLHKKPIDQVISTLTKSFPAGQILKELDLVIVDFSFPPAILLDLGTVFKSVLMLDHHKTALDDLHAANHFAIGTVVRWGANVSRFDLADNVQVFFCMTESGALMTWRHYFPGHREIDFVKYVSDRDLYQFVHPQTRLFSAGLSMYRDVAVEDMDALVNSPNALIQQGEIALKISNSRIDAALSKPAKILRAEVNGVECQIGAYNAPADITSDMLNKFVTTEGNPSIGLTYTIGSDDMVYCSMRSTRDVDCSVIAKDMGGGGHAQACGFIVPLDQWVQILKAGVLTTRSLVHLWGYRYEGSGPQPGYHLYSQNSIGGERDTFAYLGQLQDGLKDVVHDICAKHNESVQQTPQKRAE